MNVGYFDSWMASTDISIDHETMILRGNFCLACDQIFDGMIHSAVAIKHLDRLQSLGSGRIPDAPSKCQRSASSESTNALTVSIVCTIAPGSPGPLESMIPSGDHASISSADVCIGNTRTRQPRSVRHRTMFVFTPKSSNATVHLGRLQVLVRSCASAARDLTAQFQSLHGRHSSELPFNSASSVPSLQMMAFIAPCCRM